MCHRRIEQTTRLKRDPKKLRRHTGLSGKVLDVLNNLAGGKMADGNQFKDVDGKPIFKIRCGIKTWEREGMYGSSTIWMTQN